jgi:glyoxylase-like metal-dependent hydrolase (beta-lactamase superfamily II)
MEHCPICLTDPLTNSNCYILYDNTAALIIDPNNDSLIRSYMEQHHLHPETVLLTHEHCDHIAGLNALRSRYAPTVIASRECSNGIQNTTRNMTRIMETYLYFKSNGTLRVSYPKFTCAAADILFDTTYRCKWHNYSIYMTVAPGHTPGSTCIIINDEMLFSGDYLIPDEEVVTRLPGGDDAAYQKTGKAILHDLPTPIWTYPGHGKPFMLTKEVKHAYGI